MNQSENENKSPVESNPPPATESVSFTPESNPKWRKFFGPTNLLLAVFFVISLFTNGGFRPLVRRGFFCDDETIKYPMRTSTVGFVPLIAVCLILPLVVINYVDKCLKKRCDRLRESGSGDLPAIDDDDDDSAAPDSAVSRRLLDSSPDESNDDPATDPAMDPSGQPDRNQEAITSKRPQPITDVSPSQIYFFGICTCIWLTGVGKMGSGRLRPHFIEKCSPDINCSDPINLYRYIEDFSCTRIPDDSAHYYYITTSWPSGHASIAFYAMVYLTIYIHTMIPLLRDLKCQQNFMRWLNPLVLGLSSVLMISWASYVSLTRVSDYHHHATDVASGVILGIIIAFSVWKLNKMVKIPHPKASLRSSRVEATRG